MNISSLLQPFEKFGVNLGLSRITKLLASLDNPHQKVSVIHVAGTNGKGSVCAYLSSVLNESGYKTGRYTSPHLIDWHERICVNEQPITSENLYQLIQQVKAVLDPKEESSTQFEVITAAAWLYFAQQKVDIAVVEVGLGGRLDATNVCDKPLITVITSISKEHWQQLGPTISDIAGEKAGIIKAGCPVIMGPLPEDAEKVVISRSLELQSPIFTPQPATEISPGWAEYHTIYNTGSIKYQLPLKGQIQLTNSALALAGLEILKQQGWEISESAIINGIEKTKWPGRMQWFTWNNKQNNQDYQLLIDGAHNPASAAVLRKYVDSVTCHYNQPLENNSVTWVMGMLATKDHGDIFQELLRTGDKLYLVPVPDSNYANLKDLKKIALEVCPDLEFCSICEDVFSALDAAVTTSENKENRDNLLVLCGSLYLIGYFLGNSN